ncbi:MAG: hypothetical protein AB7T37_03565 [Dehalococcoidia bacterium]
MDRIDALLDAYLETGSFPPDSTAAERSEVEALAASAAIVRAAALPIAAEATRSLPHARARFERFVAASRPEPAPVVQPRRRTFGLPFLTLPRTLGIAAAVAVLVLLAGLGGQRLGAGPESVQALEIGDYVEMPGVVTASEGSGDDRLLTISSPLGDVVVEASAATSIVENDQSTSVEALRPGAQVLVVGTVLASRRVAAQTVAVGAPVPAVTEPAALQRLRDLKPDLSGTVVVLTLTPDGTRARIVLDVPGDRTYLVTVDAASARPLLELSRSLGAEVSVVRNTASPDGFSLEVATSSPVRPSASATAPATSATPSPVAERPSLVRIEGVVAAVNGRTLTLVTLDGRKTIVVRPEARILPGESGLTAEQVVSEASIGHLLILRGGIDPRTGALVADIVLAGKKVERPLQNR